MGRNEVFNEMSLLTVILSVISGVISSMGLGGGSILIILLTTVLEYPQRKAQGINIIFFLPCALYGILSYKKQGYILKDKVFPVIIFGLIGSTAGYFILDYVRADYLTKIFGCLLIYIGLRDLLKRN